MILSYLNFFKLVSKISLIISVACNEPINPPKLPITPLLEQLLIKDKDNWTESLKLLVENKISGNENITLVSIGDIDNNLIKEITDKLKLFMPKAKLKFSSDFSKVDISSNRILITAAGITSRSALNNLKYKLNNQKNKIIGWILLNYESKYLL